MNKGLVMTKHEISTYFDIPVSTLSDWRNTQNRKYKLFLFLENIDLSNIDKLLSKNKSHRIFHILNRNIDKSYAYTFDEIKNAFSKNNYNEATQREHIIYSKFFKECDINDLDTLITTFNISKRNIKRIYESSPLRTLKGVAKVWDSRFRLKHINPPKQEASSTHIPKALEHLINKRNLNV